MQLQHQLQPRLKSKTALSTALGLSLVAASLFALMGGSRIHHAAGPLPTSENASPALMREIEDEFARLRHAPLSLTPVDMGDQKETVAALDSMHLPGEERAELERSIAPAPTPGSRPEPRPPPPQILWVYVIDWAEQDGDVIQIWAPGFSRTVRIGADITPIAVPVRADAYELRISGLESPVGPITAAVGRGDGNFLRIPQLMPGQTMSFRIRKGP